MDQETFTTIRKLSDLAIETSKILGKVQQQVVELERRVEELEKRLETVEDWRSEVLEENYR